jgi:O-methyltransferase domain/Dimerisation domain
MSKHELTPHQQLLSIRLAVWQSHAIATAAKLRLADALADGPLPLADIAQRTGTDAPSLYRLLRALASTGFFAETSQNVFGNTASSECLREDVPGSQRDWVLWNFSDLDGLPEAWERLAETIRTGEAAFDKAHGCNLWEHGRQHPESATRFNNTMRSGSEGITPAIAMAYDWHRFPVIADIAGGIGTQLVAILDNCPDSSGILFDRQHVGAQVIPHARMQFVAGDFFASVPTGADAYLLRWIVHDWSDQRALDILKSVWRAMKPSARLILAEAIVPPGSEFDLGKWADVLMLVLLAGRERTEAEFQSLLAAAGFKLETVIETGCRLKLLVASPVP